MSGQKATDLGALDQAALAAGRELSCETVEHILLTGSGLRRACSGGLEHSAAGPSRSERERILVDELSGSPFTLRARGSCPPPLAGPRLRLPVAHRGNTGRWPCCTSVGSNHRSLIPAATLPRGTATTFEDESAWIVLSARGSASTVGSIGRFL
jgi:hypothetical protein